MSVSSILEGLHTNRVINESVQNKSLEWVKGYPMIEDEKVGKLLDKETKSFIKELKVLLNRKGLEQYKPIKKSNSRHQKWEHYRDKNNKYEVKFSIDTTKELGNKYIGSIWLSYNESDNSICISVSGSYASGITNVKESDIEVYKKALKKALSIIEESI